MAEFRIALGGKFEAVTGDEMNSALGAMKKDLMAHHSKVSRILRPVSASMAGGAFTTGQTATLKLGRPGSGRVWVVTRIVCLGEDDNTTHTNMMAALYIGDESNVGLAQCVRSGQSIPWTTTENEHAYICHDREDVFVKFTAIGNTTVPQFTVGIQCWEYKDCDIETQVI